MCLSLPAPANPGFGYVFLLLGGQKAIGGQKYSFHIAATKNLETQKTHLLIFYLF